MGCSGGQDAPAAGHFRRVLPRKARFHRPSDREAACGTGIGWIASRDTRLGLAGAPRERREVTVVPARCVIPVDAEGVHVAAGGLREREPSGGGVTDVVEVDRLAFFGALDALDGDVEHARDRDRPVHAVLFDLDRLRLGAAEAADQWAERADRPARLAARDPREGLALFRGGALIQDHSDGPLALYHRARCMQQDGEAQAVKPGATILAPLDVEDEARIAVPLGRPRRQPRGRTRAHEVTTAGLEVLAPDLPLRVRHDDPPLTARRPSHRVAAPS